MSVNGNIIGMPPGAGGSFPFAGTRPKMKKTLFVANSSSSVWVAPPGVYHIILQMVGGGGGGACAGYNLTGPEVFSIAQGGGGGAAIAPSVIQVNPGTKYTLIAGRGGAGGVASTTNAVLGDSGSNSVFMSNELYISAIGGSGGSVTIVQNPSLGLLSNNGGIVTATTSVLGVVGVSGGSGGSGTGSATLSGSNVDYAIGGPGVTRQQSLGAGPTSNQFRIGGGGASLYASGGRASNTSTTPDIPGGYGAGGGGAISTGLLGSFGYGAPGGSGSGGFVRITWEE